MRMLRYQTSHAPQGVSEVLIIDESTLLSYKPFFYPLILAFLCPLGAPGGRRDFLPLPQGEGWGEGVQKVFFTD